MKILALIPARGGSKRLPGKNIKPLGGRPLIAWTIRAASDSGVCCAVQVSTDDPEIAEVATRYGARVPGLRPPELATDTAGSVDVALHALTLYESTHGPVDGLLLLQPTSPFRTAETIRSAVALFAQHQGDRPVVSLSPASCHPAWCFRNTASGMEPFLGWEVLGARSQDLEPAYMLNGAIYVISPLSLQTNRTFLTPDTLGLTLKDPDESIDVDTPEDFERCEQVLRTCRGVAP